MMMTLTAQAIDNTRELIVNICKISKGRLSELRDTLLRALVGKSRELAQTCRRAEQNADTGSTGAAPSDWRRSTDGYEVQYAEVSKTGGVEGREDWERGTIRRTWDPAFVSFDSSLAAALHVMSGR